MLPPTILPSIMLPSMKAVGRVWRHLYLALAILLSCIGHAGAAEEWADFDLSGIWRCVGMCGDRAGMTLTIRQTGGILDIAASSGETLKGYANVYRKTRSSLKCLLENPPPECATMKTTYERTVVLGQPPAGWSCKLIPFDANQHSDQAPPFKAATFNVVSTGGSGKCDVEGTMWSLDTGNILAAAPPTLSLTCDIDLVGPDGKFKSSGMSVAVRPGQESAYGWVAAISARGRTELEKDVAMGASLPGDAVWKHAQEIAQKAAPGIDWMGVKTIREVNIAFSASLAGQRGIIIYELKDAQAKPLARIVAIEETTLGRCQ